MFSSKSIPVVPYGLKSLLEGVSRAVIRTKPSNITQFAAVYFEELILFREGNASLDIKDLVKQFHQIKVEKWSPGTAQEKVLECPKEVKGTPTVSQEPTRMEKSTYTEEDNVAGPLVSNKTTQFPSVQADLFLQTEETTKAVGGPSKPSTPKTASPPSSPSPAAVSPEFAYVPADPAQFATQMLGKVSSIHSDPSDVLMVDVATSIPVIPNEALSEVAEDTEIAASVVCPGEGEAMQVVSHTSVHVDLGSKPKDDKAEPSSASSLPLQAEQEPPAYDQAPKVPLQADTGVTSTVRITSVFKDEPVIEGVTYVEQPPEQAVFPFTAQVTSVKETELSPPLNPTLASETASGMSAKNDTSVHVEAEATILISETSLKGLLTQSLYAEGPTTAVGPEKSLHLEVEVIALAPGQEENAAAPEMEVRPMSSGEAAEAVHSGASVRSSSHPPTPVAEGLSEPEIEPEREAAPEQGLMEPDAENEAV
ncbi:calcium-binding tyrosine phosphorylation-regulated protein isoform 3-T6 [Rhynchonycteris naso]